MFERYQAKLDRLIHAVLNTSGDTSSALRQTIVARGKGQLGNQTKAMEALVPRQLTEFVDKITFSAYDISDEDVATLHAAGYSDDAILEIIDSASLAAGIGRLEIVCAAMQGKAGT
jgi:alkylhydroperoxidase family enzyme